MAEACNKLVFEYQLVFLHDIIATACRRVVMETRRYTLILYPSCLFFATGLRMCLTNETLIIMK